MEPYGFPQGSDLTQARLGEPFLLHQITPASLDSQRASQSVRALISPTTRWHFPVLLGTEARALLVVDRDGEGWKAVSLGYANLTGELNLIWKQWPASRGYHPQVVAMFRAKQHLFSVPENDDLNLTPIEAVPMQARSPKADTSQSGDRLRYSVLGHIAEAVQQLRSATRGQE